MCISLTCAYIQCFPFVCDYGPVMWIVNIYIYKRSMRNKQIRFICCDKNIEYWLKCKYILKYMVIVNMIKRKSTFTYELESFHKDNNFTWILFIKIFLTFYVLRHLYKNTLSKKTKNPLWWILFLRKSEQKCQLMNNSFSQIPHLPLPQHLYIFHKRSFYINNITRTSIIIVSKRSKHGVFEELQHEDSVGNSSCILSLFIFVGFFTQQKIHNTKRDTCHRSVQ